MTHLISLEQAFKIAEVPRFKEDSPEQWADVMYVAAAKILQIDHLDLPGTPITPDFLYDGQVAFYQLRVINKAVIGEWKADWEHLKSPKWFPHFRMDDPGFRFDSARYVGSNIASCMGNQLPFETKQQAKFVGQSCVWLYKEFFGGPVLAPIKTIPYDTN